ncbi:glycosyltransferase family 39 protein [Oculatella sp. LEGE 06141]|uniref:glycosyltransferase family 39 protein n=1 Tax=Oculatella sp. LEGE 06141 TaxID=1828648 RepID=UPI00187E2CA0|nr:glycosyltransferase family 39 protein [Oculatella sp. LEGE 06141]MBE9178577.1 glycosyltransferase family 39 protein [Oculatella sp. LEGE 06141]
MAVQVADFGDEDDQRLRWTLLLLVWKRNEMKHPLISSRSRLMFVVVAALVLGLFFRVTHIGQKVYWHDEVFTSIRSAGYLSDEIVPTVFSGRLLSPESLLQYQRLSPEHGWAQTWQALTTHPEHPPLYYLLTRFWMEQFGSEVAAVRSVSVVISLLAFPALYWLCRELFDSVIVPWVAIALFAVSPFHVLYAQEARQYSLWTLATLLAAAALLRSLRLNTKGSWGLYAATVALNLNISLLAVVPLFAHGLVVLAPHTFTWQRLRRFLVSLLVGSLAFVPWIIVLIRNWLALRSKTAWTTASPPKSVLVKLWGLHFSSDFIDFGVPLEHVYTYIVPPVVLMMLGCALWLLCRRAPFRSRLLVVLLVVLPSIALILPDLVLGGQRSSSTRYFVPTLVGVQLAIAYLITHLLQHCASLQRRLGRGLLLLLLTLGVISCGLSWHAETWWTKGVSYSNASNARFLNQLDQAVVISSLWDNTLGNVISLSHLVKDEVQFQLVIDPMVPDLPDGGDRFLFYPTDALLQALQANSFTVEPVVQDNVSLLKLVDP